MKILIAILISMTGILSAACETSAECWELTLKESIGISPWFIISMAAVMICLTGAAILYMIAHSFSLEKYKKIAMSEIMQGFASLILVALLFGMELSEQSLIPMIEAQAGAIAGSALGLGGKGEIVVASPIDLSLAFSRNLVACLENMYKNVYSDSKSTEMYMNLGTRIEVVGKALPVDWSLFNPRLIKKVQEFEYLADELTWLSIVMYAQINLLRFISSSMFTLFLPIGIILRAFPPTRGAGAIIMAFAIGLYIVYPLVYSLLALSSPKEAEGCDLTIQTQAVVTSDICPMTPAGFTTIAKRASSSLESSGTEIPKIATGASQIRYIAYVYLFIALGATLVFIKSTSGILGADISELGRGIMKMA